MHNYLYFSTGSIGFEDFAEDSGQVLKELYRSTEENEWKLYRMHFLLMEEQQEEAKAAMEALEEIAQKGGFKPLEANYFLYLKAMYYRTPEVISKAAVSYNHLFIGRWYLSGIKIILQGSWFQRKGQLLWMGLSDHDESVSKRNLP